MAYLAMFVDARRPLTSVEVHSVQNYPNVRVLSFQCSDDAFNIHFKRPEELERFIALIGSAIQDHNAKLDDGGPPSPGGIDLSAPIDAADGTIAANMPRRVDRRVDPVDAAPFQTQVS